MSDRADVVQNGNPAADRATTAVNGPERVPVVVKKYANRRLYNTESSSYITLETLADMVREGRDFVVYDAKTSEDITRSVLTQIILEEESKGRAMLPTGFLRQLIGFYGDSMQALLPRYLEQAMSSFARQQEQVRRAMQQTLGPFMPFTGIEEVGRQNMAMMERAMSLFSPFYREAEMAEGRPGSGATGAITGAITGAAMAATVSGPTEHDGQVAALLAEVESLRQQLAALSTEQAEMKQAPPTPVLSTTALSTTALSTPALSTPALPTPPLATPALSKHALSKPGPSKPVLPAAANAATNGAHPPANPKLASHGES